MKEPDELWDKVVYRSLGKSPAGRVFARGHLRASRGLRDFRTLPHFALVYILAGNGYYEAEDTGKIPLRAGDAVLVFPGVPHRYEPTEPAGWSEIYLLFEGAAFESWRQAGIIQSRSPILHALPVERWARRISEILPSVPTARLSCAAALQAVCQTQTLLSDLIAAKSRTDGSVDAPWFEQACALLEATPFRGLDDIARQLKTNADCFRKRFQRIAGVSPTRYRLAHLIDRACVLLQQGRLRNYEIAEALGFHDAAHFSKRFKAHIGRAPTEFRRALTG